MLRVVVWDCYVDLLIVLGLRFVVAIIAGVFAIIICYCLLLSCGLVVIGSFDGVLILIAMIV